MPILSEVSNVTLGGSHRSVMVEVEPVRAAEPEVVTAEREVEAAQGAQRRAAKHTGSGDGAPVGRRGLRRRARADGRTAARGRARQRHALRRPRVGDALAALVGGHLLQGDVRLVRVGGVYGAVDDAVGTLSDLLQVGEVSRRGLVSECGCGVGVPGGLGLQPRLLPRAGRGQGGLLQAHEPALLRGVPVVHRRAGRPRRGGREEEASARGERGMTAELTRCFNNPYMIIGAPTGSAPRRAARAAARGRRRGPRGHHRDHEPDAAVARGARRYVVEGS